METIRYIAERIKEFRTKNDLTEGQLGMLLVPKRSGKTISSWETARTKPDNDALAQLSCILNVSLTDFYPEDLGLNELAQGFVDVALYGTISAGKPLAVIPIDDTYPVPTEMMKKYPESFLLKVKGESMNNVLPHGSYALIDPSQSEPVDNKAYALCVNGGDATIKRIRHLENGYELLPDSKDPTFRPITFDHANKDNDEIIILGRVVWVMLPFDWEV